MKIHGIPKTKPCANFANQQIIPCCDENVQFVSCGVSRLCCSWMSQYFSGNFVPSFELSFLPNQASASSPRSCRRYLDSRKQLSTQDPLASPADNNIDHQGFGHSIVIYSRQSFVPPESLHLRSVQSPNSSKTSTITQTLDQFRLHYQIPCPFPSR